MKPVIVLAALACLAAAPAAAATNRANDIPTERGACVATTFQHMSYRGDDPRNGDMALYADGIWAYTADGVVNKAIEASQAGDPIELCLADPPATCKGVKTGRFFAAINMRSQQYWMLPEQPEACAGG